MNTSVAFLCILGFVAASKQSITRASRQILVPVVHPVHHLSPPVYQVSPYGHHVPANLHHTLYHGSAAGLSGSFGRSGPSSAPSTALVVTPDQATASSSQGTSSERARAQLVQQQGGNQLGQSFGNSQTSSSGNSRSNSQQPGLSTYYSFGAQGSAQSNTNNAPVTYQISPQPMQGSTQSTSSDNQNQGQNIPILSQSYTQLPDGSYNFGYRTGNGIHFTETASVLPGVYPTHY